MLQDKSFFRRKLPHVQPEHATYFITFRLADTLPAEVLKRLQEERDNEMRSVGQDRILSNRIAEKYFVRFDQYLNRVRAGSQYLRSDRIAKIVADALHYWDGRRYELLCYCIMPNHVHLVVSLENFHSTTFKNVHNLSYELSPVLHSIKRFTAREANKVLCREGAFWQHESYDHMVRTGRELGRIVRYILENPVAAGLVCHWSKWKWSYVSDKLIEDVESPARGFVRARGENDAGYQNFF